MFFILSYKQITTGEGGVVITNNKIFIIKLKLKAGIDKAIKDRKLPGKYDVKKLGLIIEWQNYMLHGIITIAKI